MFYSDFLRNRDCWAETKIWTPLRSLADYTQIEGEPKGGLDGKAVYRAAPDRVSG